MRVRDSPLPDRLPCCCWPWPSIWMTMLKEAQTAPWGAIFYIMAWIWCGTAGVFRLNTLVEVLGLSGSIFMRKMISWFCHWWWNHLCRKHTTRLIAIFIASKIWCRNSVCHGGGNLGNKVTNTFPLFFSKLNKTAWHVNMPGRRTLSAHGAGKLIVKTDWQTKTKKKRMQNCLSWAACTPCSTACITLW
jgi:hypothetical protein